jgi:hypothetical protein
MVNLQMVEEGPYGTDVCVFAQGFGEYAFRAGDRCRFRPYNVEGNHLMPVDDAAGSAHLAACIVLEAKSRGTHDEKFAEAAAG